MLYNVDAETMRSLGISRHSDACAAAAWGFKTPTGRRLEVVRDVPDIMKAVSHWEQARHDLEFAIDGLVISGSIRPTKGLGMTSKSPRWALAYKFETERVSTSLWGSVSGWSNGSRDSRGGP